MVIRSFEEIEFDISHYATKQGEQTNALENMLKYESAWFLLSSLFFAGSLRVAYTFILPRLSHA